MAKILVVDDSGLARKLLKSILEPVGHEIVEAEDGIAAIELCLLENFDLVLLDLTMPGMDGFEVLSRLKKINSELPVVIVSADIQQSSRELARRGDAFAFVTKPVAADELREVVNEALASAAR